ncbi:MAG: methylated-DNA-protein-cysteine methyltransferase-like protein [Planctomycetota bacterium]|jgi:methylated-DNA-protein-cysteine methyltransferase-like protein
MFSTDDPRVQRILATVDSIPPGCVATYGQVATEAGLPGRARMVGSVLRKESAQELPWHRVLGAGGVIRVPGEAAREQARRLESEGVMVKRGRVDLASHRWG